MSEQTYDIYFRGEALDGADINTVKAHFAKLFKADDAKLAQLFSGKVIPLKKNLVKSDAAKFQQLFKKAGAKIYIKAVEEPNKAAAPVPTEEAKVEEAVPTPNETTSSTEPSSPTPTQTIAEDERSSIEPGSTEAPKTIPDGVHAVNMDEIDFDVLPPGSDILNESERAEEIDVDIDISNINLASVFDTPEVDTTPAPPAPDVSHISTAAVGSDLSEGIAREPQPEAPNVEHITVAEAGTRLLDIYDDIPDIPPDVSDISLAPVGSDLDQIKEEKEIKVPDISHIKLDD